MLLLLSALVVAAAIGWAGYTIAGRIDAQKTSEMSAAEVIAMFAPGIAAAAQDPKALLTWQPIALSTRKLLPRQFAELDAAFGGRFPFTDAQLQDAHARWTTEWLGWERWHDAEFKLKTATVDHELGDDRSSAYGRARLDAIEREKLDRYQRRYEEYTRVARALQALIARP